MAIYHRSRRQGNWYSVERLRNKVFTLTFDNGKEFAHHALIGDIL